MFSPNAWPSSSLFFSARAHLFDEFLVGGGVQDPGPCVLSVSIQVAYFLLKPRVFSFAFLLPLPSGPQHYSLYISKGSLVFECT